MTRRPISERLRQYGDRSEVEMHEDRDEAADVIDALVAALEAMRDGVLDVLHRERLYQVVDTALAQTKP